MALGCPVFLLGGEPQTIQIVPMGDKKTVYLHAEVSGDDRFYPAWSSAEFDIYKPPELDIPPSYRIAVGSYFECRLDTKNAVKTAKEAGETAGLAARYPAKAGEQLAPMNKLGR